MALQKNLVNPGPSSGNASIKTVCYGKADDTLTTIEGAGYFNPVAYLFQDGDFLHVTGSNGSKQYSVAKSGSTITITAVT